MGSVTGAWDFLSESQKGGVAYALAVVGCGRMSVAERIRAGGGSCNTKSTTLGIRKWATKRRRRDAWHEATQRCSKGEIEKCDHLVTYIAPAVRSVTFCASLI